MVAAVHARQPEKPILLYDLLPEPGICPYAQRAKITLREKKLPYEQKLIDAQNKPQDFLDIFRGVLSDPKGRGTVPTIVDNELKLTESHVVSEYLDTAYPDAGEKLFPTDAKKLAQVRLFVELYSTQVQPNHFKQLTSESSEDAEAAKEAFLHGLKVLDTFLKDHGESSGPFLLGKTFSYAEAATLPFLYRSFLALKHFRGFDVAKAIKENAWQHLDAWYKEGFARASVKDTLPTADQLIPIWAKRFKLQSTK